MSDTWRSSPKGKKKEPRPPAKGGQHNLVREFIEEKEQEVEDGSSEDDDARN